MPMIFFLISHSVSVMQRMLNVCCIVLNDLDLKFNVKKSVLLRIGQRFKVPCAPLILDNQTIRVVEECKYLGIYICCGKNFFCHYDHVKFKFCRSFNSLYAKSKSASSECISTQLLRAYCLPIILYACEAMRPNKTIISMLDGLVNKAR